MQRGMEGRKRERKKEVRGRKDEERKERRKDEIMDS